MTLDDNIKRVFRKYKKYPSYATAKALVEIKAIFERDKDKLIRIIKDWQKDKDKFLRKDVERILASMIVEGDVYKEGG